jgi:probable HAF family extracellular repeat protein
MALSLAAAAQAQANWTIADLGDLGGGVALASDINDSGQVVGMSSTAAGEFHAFIWTATDGMTDLGTLGSTQSAANAINNAGQVVGYSLTATGRFHAFLWTAATGMRDLGLGDSAAADINEMGQVVGGAVTASGHGHAFLWTAASGMVSLGSLAGPNGQSGAFAINDLGQVVGQSQLPSPGGIQACPPASFCNHAFLWSSTTGMIDLGALGSTDWSLADDINNAGQVVGWSGPVSGFLRPFLWTANAGMTALGTLDGNGGVSTAINEAGQISGLRTTSSERHAVVWPSGSGPVDLATLGGPSSYAASINEAGQIVGQSLSIGEGTGHPDIAEGHAVLWTPNTETPAQQIESLVETTEDLVANGSLRPGQANGLTRPLQNALRSLARGSIASACSQLHDFKVEVSAKIRDGALSAAEGMALIDAADAIRAALGC